MYIVRYVMFLSDFSLGYEGLVQLSGTRHFHKNIQTGTSVSMSLCACLYVNVRVCVCVCVCVCACVCVWGG